MNDTIASGSGPGLLSSMGIIIIAAAVTAGAVTAYVVYERGLLIPTEYKIQEIVEQNNAEQDESTGLTVPPFSLTDQYNVTFESDMLEGKYWIADFGFTQCRGVCPAMNNAMREVVQTLMLLPYWNDIRIIRFSVDPQHDTPEVNREYFQTQILDQFAADRREDIRKHWFILTGDKTQIWTLCEEGFKLPVEDDPDNTAMPIAHSSKFALVGPDMQIIDYYNSLEAEDLSRLLLDINERLADKSAP